MVGAIGVKGQLDPLLAKGHIHSLSMSEDEEASRPKILWGDGRRSLILLQVMPINNVVFGLPSPLYPGIEFLHVSPLWEESSRTVIGGLVLIMSETVYPGQGGVSRLGR